MHKLGRSWKDYVFAGAGKLRLTVSEDSVILSPEWSRQLANYEVILGKPWLYKYNPRIDFRRNHVDFKDGNQDGNTGGTPSTESRLIEAMAPGEAGGVR